MKAKSIIKELSCFDNSSEVMITSNPMYCSHSYLYTRFNKNVIEFSEHQSMPSLYNHELVNNLQKVDESEDIIARNIDTNKTYKIIGVDGDDDAEMGNDVYVYINDEID